MMTLMPTLLLFFTRPFFLPAADDPDPDSPTIKFTINSRSKSKACFIQILTKLRWAMFKQDGTGSNTIAHDDVIIQPVGKVHRETSLH